MSKQHPEYCIRVKLPDPAGYSCSPSGDTAFDIAYDKAMMESMPIGFHLVKLRLNERYAIDSAGRSIVLIEPTPDSTDTLSWYIEETKRLEAKLEQIRKAVS